MPYLNNSFRVASGSRWARALRMFRGGLGVRGHLATFSVVAFGCCFWLLLSGVDGSEGLRGYHIRIRGPTIEEVLVETQFAWVAS